MAHSPYNAKSELFKAYPKMQALSKEANEVMEGAEETLSEREFAGCDTSWARARLYEAEWRINCTNDFKAACHAVERLNVKRASHGRKLYFPSSLPSWAACQVLPPSLDSSTRATPLSPPKAMARA